MSRVFARVFKLLAAGLLLQAATVAQAQSLRCNGDLTQIGDTKYAVLQKCGEPAFKDSFCKPLEIWVPDSRYGGYGRRVPPQVLPCQPVEEWSYNPGPGNFVAIVRFEAGAVSAIRQGDRVR